MTSTGFLAVAAGAVLGAWLRWGLSTWFNPLFASLPIGTLASNLIGGFLVGVAVSYFAAHATLAPEWRLACITGFLGALTTFSTFSAESVQLLMNAQYAAAGLHTGAHLLGSVVATVLGIAAFRLLA